MKLKFSLTYSPIEEYNVIGYHTTFSRYKDSILKNGFHFSNSNHEWLGEGVYFWDKRKTLYGGKRILVYWIDVSLFAI